MLYVNSLVTIFKIGVLKFVDIICFNSTITANAWNTTNGELIFTYLESMSSNEADIIFVKVIIATELKTPEQ
jgi:hypothetical protein